MTLDEYTAAVETALSAAKGACRECDENRAAAMLNRKQLCYRCDCLQRGSPVIEAHHVFGNNIPLTIDVPVNEHRLLDAMRFSRPKNLQKMGADLILNVTQITLLLSEIATLVTYHGRRGRLPDWVVPAAELLGEKGREAADALLQYGGHASKLATAEWHDGMPQWQP